MNDDGLAAFYAARLDEDEAAAKAWLPRVRLTGSSNWYDELSDADLGPYSVAHAARHDPARVLREVEAGRAIVGLHHAELIETINADGDERSGDWCAECDYESFPCPTLRHLAAVYSTHPDYQESWKP